MSTPLRNTVIARRLFATAGSNLNDTAWDSRKRSVLEELFLQLPALRQLTASSLHTSFEVTDKNIFLLVSMEESMQRSMVFQSKSQVSNDMYAHEVFKVCAEQAALPERFEQSLRSIEDPAAHPHLAQMRQLIWQHRKNGRIHISSSLQGEWVDIPHVTSTLPGTGRVEVDVQLLTIGKSEVKASLLGDLVCPIRQIQLFHRGKAIRLHRHPLFRKMSDTMYLSRLMHDCTTVCARIEIEYDWVNGQPHRLTLEPLCGSSGDEGQANVLRSQA